MPAECFACAQTVQMNNILLMMSAVVFAHGTLLTVEGQMKSGGSGLRAHSRSRACTGFSPQAIWLWDACSRSQEASKV